MKERVSKNVVAGLVALSLLLTAAICFLVYRNTSVPDTIRMDKYPPYEGDLVWELTCSDSLSEATEIVPMETSDNVTSLDTIQGNGYREDYIEISGSAYVPGESIELFDTAVVLWAEGAKNALLLKTEAVSDDALTKSEGNGTYNYNYAFFRSAVAKKYLDPGVRYQVLLLYGNNQSPKSLVPTSYSLVLNDQNILEVTNEPS